MSDLISRSALIEEIESLQVTITGLRAGKGVLAEYMKQYRNSVQNIIHEQPTAYDVDKVVKEIKEVGTRFCCVSVHCNNECSNCDHGAIMKAIIEIVKGGGVNGTNCT